MTLWEILKANKTGIAPDMFTMLAASKMNGGRDRLHELSGTPPLSFTAKGKPLTAWSITGNTVQNGTPTPENPVEVQGVGDRTGNLFDSSTLANDYTLNVTTGLPYAFPKRIATLIPIDVSTLTSVTLSYQSEITNTMFIYAVLNGSILVSRVASNHSGDTIDVSGGDNLYISFYSQPDNITTDKISNIMLNTGSTALPYEPYGYKIPVVTRGKNLAGNYTVSSGYYYDDSGTPTQPDARFIRLAINVEPNTIYTISSNLKFYSIWEFNNNTKISRRGGGNSNKYTIKTTKECNSLRISMSNTSGEADTSAFEWIQLEKGSTATPYEPYHEPITTPIYLPTPLYSGEVMRSDGSREVKWGVVDLSSLTWENEFDLSQGQIRADNLSNPIISTMVYGGNCYCQSYMYDGIKKYTEIKNNSIAFSNSKQIPFLRIKNTSYDNAQDLINSLSGVKLYYELAKPTTETFTAPQIPTLNGTTVIDVDTAVKPESMTIKYRR